MLMKPHVRTAQQGESKLSLGKGIARSRLRQVVLGEARC